MSDITKPLDTLSDDELRATDCRSAGHSPDAGTENTHFRRPRHRHVGRSGRYERQCCLGTRSAQARVA
jgi:hypothetical protein